jgi:hypothetical protein
MVAPEPLRALWCRALGAQLGAAAVFTVSTASAAAAAERRAADQQLMAQAAAVSAAAAAAGAAAAAAAAAAARRGAVRQLRGGGGRRAALLRELSELQWLRGRGSVDFADLLVPASYHAPGSHGGGEGSPDEQEAGTCGGGGGGGGGGVLAVLPVPVLVLSTLLEIRFVRLVTAAVLPTAAVGAQAGNMELARR